MSLPSSPPSVPDLATEVRRLAELLRRLSPARLARPLPPYASVADAGHAVAQRLVDVRQALEDPSATPRTVPRLADRAVGDQVAVCGDDLVAAVTDAGVDPAESARAEQEGIDALRQLRLAL